MSRARFRTVVVLLAAAAWLGPVRANAQFDADQQQDDPTFLYANEMLPKDALVYGINGNFFYDTNPFGARTGATADYGFVGGGLFSLWKTYDRSRFKLSYRPDFMFYRQASGLNRLNHSFGFDGELLITSHFVLRISDALAVRRGSFELRSSDSLQPHPIVPGGLNSSIYIPTASELGNQTNLEGDLQLSPRTSVSLLGSYAVRKFLGNAGPAAFLLDSKTVSGGAGWSYRTSQNTSLGVGYLYQDIRFAQVATDRIHNGYLTFWWEMWPGLSLTVSGGPAYAIPDEPASLMLPGFPPPVANSSAARNRVEGAASGQLLWRSNDTVLRIRASRELSDGGGLLALVRESAVGIEVRRRLTGNWDLIVRARGSQATSLSEFYGTGGISSQSGTVALEYKLKNVILHFSYLYQRQRISGTIPFAVSFDRSQGGTGFFYQNAGPESPE
jgi:hypothetical protein